VQIILQNEGNTVVSIPKSPLTTNEAKEEAEKIIESLGQPFNYVILDICSIEDWQNRRVNGCPRCLKKFDQPLEGIKECPSCGSFLDIQIW